MCRNIKKLRQPERMPAEPELQDAALQFVRKISGFRVPSQQNREAFDQAVLDIASVSKELFKKMKVKK
jgi:hypothetical protein